MEELQSFNFNFFLNRLSAFHFPVIPYNSFFERERWWSIKLSTVLKWCQLPAPLDTDSGGEID